MEKESKLREIVNNAFRHHSEPSIQFACIDKNQIEEIVFGYKDLENEINADFETQYGIGSITKVFVSLAIAKLVEEKKLTYGTKVIEILEEFRLKDDYRTNELNIVDLLAHKTGLPRHDFVWFYNGKTVKEILDSLRYLDFSSDLRLEMKYQNHMYIVLGEIIEKISKKTWQNYIKEKILDPLNMKYTNFSIEDMIQSQNFALPYAGINTNNLISFKNIDNIGAAASMNSSVRDMIKLVSFLLNGDTKILDDRSLKNIMMPHSLSSNINSWKGDNVKFSAYGLGMFIENYNNNLVFYHHGNIDGYSSILSIVPSHNFGFVALVNKSYALSLMALQYSIYDYLLDIEKQSWNDHISKFAKQVVKSIDDKYNNLISSNQANTRQYIGEYHHPAYGVIKITEEDKLIFDYGDLKTALEYSKDNKFILYIPVELILVTVEFIEEGLAIKAEPELPKIIFKKHRMERLNER